MLKINTFGLFNFLPFLALEVRELIITLDNFPLHDRVAQEWINQADSRLKFFAAILLTLNCPREVI